MFRFMTSLLLVASGVANLVLFILFLVYGPQFFYESNKQVLWGETAASAIICIIGVSRLIEGFEKGEY